MTPPLGPWGQPGVISRKHIFLQSQTICLWCVFISALNNNHDSVLPGMPVKFYLARKGPRSQCDTEGQRVDITILQSSRQAAQFLSNIFTSLTRSLDSPKGWKPFHVAFYNLVTDGSLNFIWVHNSKSGTRGEERRVLISFCLRVTRLAVGWSWNGGN